MKNLKAVILAGGKGTRLYPITYELPKPLLPVKRRPIINYLVDLFLRYKINDIAVLVSKEFKEEFAWWKKRYYPRNKIQIAEEPKPLGTFGGLWFLKNWLGSSDFFLTNGDELKTLNLQNLIRFHRSNNSLATIAIIKIKNPENYGVVVMEGNRIKRFVEKPKNPPTNYINSGLYLLNKTIFNYHPGPKFSMIEKDIFPKLAEQGKLNGVKMRGKWLDCGTWARYEEAIRLWQKRLSN